jgi:hypothetical protein
MTASNAPITKATIPSDPIPSRSYKTQAAAARFAVLPLIGHRPTEPLGRLEHAPLTQASPQAEGSQDKAVPLKAEHCRYKLKLKLKTF